MAVKYKLYQDNRKESKNKGMWYARAIVSGMLDTKKIAQMIQTNVSVKKSDVLAVLDELVEVMTIWLGEGYRVKLDGFGSFKIALNSKAADSREEFSVRKNITGLRMVFNPEVRIGQDGHRSKSFIEGCTLSELTPYDDGKDEEHVEP